MKQTASRHPRRSGGPLPAGPAALEPAGAVGALVAGVSGLLLAGSLLACGASGDASRATRPSPDESADATRRALDDPASRWRSAMEALHVPGMVVAVVGPNGPLLVEELGRRNLEEDLPVTSETRFYIASATKPFVALATALLAHRDSIQLNRPVRTYLPRFRLADYTESITITVRDLLAHRRGLQDYAITFGEAYTGQMTEERFYRLLNSVEAVGELDYQNLHYTLLGRVIEAVTGDTWKDFVEREVFRPAGMARTTTRGRPLSEDPDAAVPYTLTGGELEPTRLKTDRTMHAAGGMLSTADDLVRWIRIHLNDGQLDGEAVFPAELIREMQAPQIYEEDPHPFIPEHRRIGWGLGWDIREDRGARLFYHGGRYEGWAAHTSFMPEIETGVVVLANTDDSATLLAHAVAADVYDRIRGLEPREIFPRLEPIFQQMSGGEASEGEGTGEEDDRPDRAGPSLPVGRYVGSYVNEDWGTLEVREEGGQLEARIGDLPLPLVWVGTDSLVADQDHRGRFEIRGGRVEAIYLTELAASGTVQFVRQ